MHHRSKTHGYAYEREQKGKARTKGREEKEGKGGGNSPQKFLLTALNLVNRSTSRREERIGVRACRGANTAASRVLSATVRGEQVRCE